MNLLHIKYLKFKHLHHSLLGCCLNYLFCFAYRKKNAPTTTPSVETFQIFPPNIWPESI